MIFWLSQSHICHMWDHFQRQRNEGNFFKTHKDTWFQKWSGFYLPCYLTTSTQSTAKSLPNFVGTPVWPLDFLKQLEPKHLRAKRLRQLKHSSQII